MVHREVKIALDKIIRGPEMSGVTTYNGVIQRLIFNSYASGSWLTQ
jgi:hypothetical protein